MNARLEAVLSSVVTVCAVAVAVTFVYSQVATRRSGAVEQRPPTFVEDWDRLLEGGLRIGPRSAPVQIVEFGDFQCPFCRTFHAAVERVIAEMPDKVSLVYYHLPLPIHQYADAAARAAGCAAEQGRFAPMAHGLYTDQDSIGARPWTAYARSAGVKDMAVFVSCMDNDSTRTRIDADRALAAGLSIEGTPTVVVNGWRLSRPPTVDSLRHVAREVVAGRSPFPRRRHSAPVSR